MSQPFRWTSVVPTCRKDWLKSFTGRWPRILLQDTAGQGEGVAMILKGQVFHAAGVATEVPDRANVFGEGQRHTV